MYFNFGSFGIFLVYPDTPKNENTRITCPSGRIYEIKEKEVLGITQGIIPKEDVTSDFLNTVFSYRFHTLLFGNNAEATKQYRQKVVPDLLTQLHDRVPDIYEMLIADYPEWKQDVQNYIGRIAYISTMKDGSVLKTKNGETYTLHDGFLTGTYYSAFLPFGSRQAELKIAVTEDMNDIIILW